MRRCRVEKTLLPFRLWHYRSLRTSPYSRPRAVKQLNNAELLQVVQQINGYEESGHRDANPTVDEIAADDRDELIQSSSRLSVHSPPLPRSPIARSRHIAEKPPPSKERSRFQLKLSKNPYAQALSTPPRLCLLTGIRLPSYFQIPFGLAKHPKTGAVWHLPRLPSFASTSEDGSSPPSPPSSSASESESESASKVTIRTASGTHLVASRASLAHISKLTKAAYMRILPYRWKEDPSFKASEIVWREDMDEFVLKMLRESLVKKLDYLASRSKAYITPCDCYDNISDHKQIGAVLWLGSEPGLPSPGASSNPTSDIQDQGPPFYAMYRYKDQYIPFYNLPLLLGSANIQVLKDSKSTRFRTQIAVIKAKRPTMELHFELWKLMGYLANESGGNAEADMVSNQSV